MAGKPVSVEGPSFVFDWGTVQDPLTRSRSWINLKSASGFLEKSQQQNNVFSSLYWRVGLGVLAFLDSTLTIVLHHHSHNYALHPDTCGHQHDSLYRVSFVVSATFSLLYFVDMVFKTKLERDRMLLDVKKQQYLRRSQQWSKEKIKYAWFIFFATVAFHVALLPLGLFSFIPGVDRLDSQSCILRLLLESLWSLVTNMIGEELLIQKKLLMRKLLRASIRRPFLSWHRFRVIWRALRLSMNVGPVMGLLVKGLANIVDVQKNMVQQILCYLAYRRRRQHWKKLDLQGKRELAATRIQSAFRGMQTRKGVRSFMSMLKARRSNTHSVTSSQSSSSMSSTAADPRGLTQFDLKRLELRRLQDAKDRGECNVEQHRRMYELQHEIHQAADSIINKHLLLRPTSKFVFVWKTVFVICVSMDIASQLAQQIHWIKGGMKHESSADGFDLFRSMIPLPATEWKECLPEDHVNPLSRFWKHISQHNQQHQDPFLSPWYCNEHVQNLQVKFVQTSHVFLSQLFVFIWIICYVDVFVTFFIGEFNREGHLVPKSFFVRWLFPGLMLELLANPQFETTTRFLFGMRDLIMDIGPVRLWRWIVACFYPWSITITRQLRERVLKPAVVEQNKQVLDEDNLVSSFAIYQSTNSILGKSARRSVYYAGNPMSTSMLTHEITF